MTMFILKQGHNRKTDLEEWLQENRADPEEYGILNSAGFVHLEDEALADRFRSTWANVIKDEGPGKPVPGTSPRTH